MKAWAIVDKKGKIKTSCFNAVFLSIFPTKREASWWLANEEGEKIVKVEITKA